MACSAHGGDAAKGTLTSPEFKLTDPYICFLLAGGKHPGKKAAQLLVDGKVVRESTGENSLQMKTQVWEIAEFKGKTARIRLIDDESGSWGMIAADHFLMTDYANQKFPASTKGGKPHMAGLVASPKGAVVNCRRSATWSPSGVRERRAPSLGAAGKQW